MPAKPQIAALEMLKNDDAQKIYRKIISALSKVGPFEQEMKQTCIHLANGSAFAGVHPRKQGLLLNIRTNAAIKSKRIRKLEQASANRFHNEMLVETPAEVDAELIGWLEEAMNYKSTRTK